MPATDPPPTLPRALTRLRPRTPGLGFGTAYVHEGPPYAVRDAELRLTRTMTPRRRADFLIGRCALHRALRDAGLSADAVLCDGPRPRLPAGISASISHSNGIAVAVAGPTSLFRTLGVDLELNDVPREAAHLVLHASEAVLPEGDDAAVARHLLAAYAAKEAAFKALSPVLGAGLPGLRALRLAPHADGYLAHAPAGPGLCLRVTVHHLSRGVLAWAVPNI
ncbi:4'-phosphopantetheinyl transferase superfamily protein [Streptomyces olivoreticuli]